MQTCFRNAVVGTVKELVRDTVGTKDDVMVLDMVDEIEGLTTKLVQYGSQVRFTVHYKGYTFTLQAVQNTTPVAWDIYLGEVMPVCAYTTFARIIKNPGMGLTTVEMVAAMKRLVRSL